MARHWITYSADEDRRRRRRRLGWRWRWPWNWGRGGRRVQAVRIDSGRRRDDGERRRIWPWLLLLLLLLLVFLGGWLWYENRDENGNGTPATATGSPETGDGPDGGPARVGSGVPIGIGGNPSGDRDGGVLLSIPDMPPVRLKGDTMFMDLGDISCQEQRYVLMSDGEAHAIDNLDDETVAALSQSEVPINTVALGADADTDALQAIAQRTGGAFTKME